MMSDWLRQMSAAYGCLRVDPELAAAAARVGLAESLLCGVTTVADHHLTWPAGIDPVELAGATIDSAASSGARPVFVRGTARDDPVTAAQSIAGIHDTYLAGAVDGVSDDGRLQLAVGLSETSMRTAPRLSPHCGRSPPHSGCGAGRRPTSRSTSPSPPNGTDEDP